ncbi:MAG: hypothetical protein QXM92_03695 [Candidatus Anstonellales archaeon]
MNSVYDFNKEIRRVPIDLYNMLVYQKHIKPDTNAANCLMKIWEEYLSMNFQEFNQILKSIAEYKTRMDGIEMGADLLGKPHMEGMFDVRLYAKVREKYFELLRIPISFLPSEKSLLIHTVQGYRYSSKDNINTLKKYSKKDLSFVNIALEFIKFLSSNNYKLLFQHPTYNIWHALEMDRRKRDPNSTQLSIYESVIRKLIRTHYNQSIRKIVELYNILEELDHKYLDVLEYTYLVYTKNTSYYHPTYILRSHSYHDETTLYAYFASFDSLSLRPILKLDDLLVKIKFIIL